MSELTNRAAYLKGLADGMKLDCEKAEGKLINEIIGLLGDMADEMEALDQEQGFIADKLDELDEEVDMIGDEVFEDYDEDDEDDEFEIRCQGCDKEFLITSEDLMDGEIMCPYCGDVIEFDFDCDGDCEDCEGCDE